MTSRTSSRVLFALVSFALLQAGCKQSSDATSPTTDSSPTGARPIVAGVMPAEVKAGALITVSGSGFGDVMGTSVLTVGGATATSIASWSDSEITAVVPADALTGAVKARVQGAESDGTRLVVLWDNENPENVIVGGNRASPLNSQLLEDGDGGTMVVWNDFRSYDPVPPDDLVPPALPYDPVIVDDPHQINIYAQRLNSRGKRLWYSGGIALSTVAGGQYFPQLVSDGSGGAIVVWEDYRSGLEADIYAQRISRTGEVLWTSDVAVCAAGNRQEKPQLVSDGAGGAIVVWQDYRSGSRYEVYAQRIDGNGIPQWPSNGVAVSTALGNQDQLFPAAVSDGAGGAIVAWQDERSGTRYMYAQRLDGAGEVKWATNGVRLSTRDASYQYGLPRPVSDGLGGAIIAWESGWSITGTNIHAQRIDGSGALQWGSAGTAVTSAVGDQTEPRITTDGAGGAIIAWEDCRVGTAVRDVYAQRVNASGAPLWSTDGVPVSTAAESQYQPRIIPDDEGGAIITWYDYRDYDVWIDGTFQGVDTYAQRLDAEGAAQWGKDGVAISAARLHQMYPEIVSDHSGGAIILWEDMRTGSEVDLYAQGISLNGRQ